MVDFLKSEQKPEEKIRFKASVPILLYLGILLFFLALASYGGLFLLNRAQERATQTLLSEIKRKEGELRSEIIDQIFLLEARLKNLRTLLENHKFVSRLFGLVGETTLPLVRFSTFNFQSGTNKVDMAGQTLSYGLLAKQIGILERHPDIEKVEFGGLSRDNKFLNFRLGITLNPQTLKTIPKITGTSTNINVSTSTISN